MGQVISSLLPLTSLLNLDSSRFLLYSHDGRSYGHVSKLGAVASHLVNASETATALCATSSPFCPDFIPFLPRIDYLKLPSYYYPEAESTTAATLIPWSKQEFKIIRSQLLEVAASVYRPSCVFMECRPFGKSDEMIPILRALKAAGARVVWGMNGIVDPRIITFTEAQRQLLSELVDSVVVYSTKAIVDSVMGEDVIECTVAPIPVRYVGYLVRPQGLSDPSQAVQHGGAPNVFIQTGGGGSSGKLWRKLIPALARLRQRYAPAMQVRGSLGNFFPPGAGRDVKELIAKHGASEWFTVLQHVQKPVEEMRAADLFIGAGGYNTLCDLISCPRPSVTISVQDTEVEQFIHCEAMREIGLVGRNLAATASSEEIEFAIESMLSRPARPHTQRLPLADGISGLVDHLLHGQ